MCVGIYRSVRVEMGELDLNGPAFSVDLLDTFMRLKHIPKLLLAIIAPWFFMARAYGRLMHLGKVATIAHMIVMGAMFYGVWFLVGFEELQQGLAYVGWALYIFWSFYGCAIRTSMRTEFGINGNYHQSLWFPWVLDRLQRSV